jgi:hypothetical protein
LTAFDSGLILNFAISPDGRGLAIARGQAASDLVLISAVE